MKNLLISLLMVTGTTIGFAQSQGSLIETKKTPEQVIRQVKKGKAYLVDVRTPEEFNTAHLKYSQNIDFKSPDFKSQISKLNRKKTVYLYCRSGNRSGKAVDTLKMLGFNTPFNIGGLSTLTVAGLPIAEVGGEK